MPWLRTVEEEALSALTRIYSGVVDFSGCVDKALFWRGDREDEKQPSK
jgi:hypothetical protein